MRNVLFIEPWFPPIGGMAGLRSLKFVKYLPEYGWKPIVLTVREGDHYYYDATLLEEVPVDVNIHRTSALLPTKLARILKYRLHPSQVINRDTSSATVLPGGSNSKLWGYLKRLVADYIFVPDYYIGWLPFALTKGLHLLHRQHIDIIFTTSGAKTAHLVGLCLKRLTGKPWVADFRDPWTAHSLKPRAWPGRSIERVMEKAVLESADRIVIAWPDIGEAFLRQYKFLSSSKITIITNGFDPDDFRDSPSGAGHEEFIVTHTGSLYPPRAIKPFLAALTQLPQEVKEVLKVNLIGGMYESDKELPVQMGLDGIVNTKPFAAHREAIGHTLIADVLLLLIGTYRESKGHLPGKLFDYLGARKPILALIPPKGEAAHIIKETGTGIVVHPEDTTGIREAIIGMYQSYKVGSLRLNDVTSASLKRFERRELAKELAAVFNSHLRGGKQSG